MAHCRTQKNTVMQVPPPFSTPWRGIPDLTLPNLERLGLMKIPGMEKFATGAEPQGVYGKCRELSKGKDSIVGHWEVMGVPTRMAFDTFPDGFPQEIIDAFTKMIGRGILGNEVASGTEIIARLGGGAPENRFPHCLYLCRQRIPDCRS